ncbi:MAG: fibronectin type III domain-containing protein, partial [Actinomycetota bacterium]
MLLTAMSAMLFGASSPSTAGANPQVPTAPTEPLNVAVAPYDSAASVSWSVPLSNGGSPITSFTVTSTPEGKSCTTPDGATNSCLVADLTNGVAYTFVVIATNIVGDSNQSAPSASETPYSFPSAPSITSTSGTDGGVEVTWSPPLSDGGRPISSYTVTSDPEAKTCTTPDGATTSCTVTGLTNGFSYTFTVAATNEAGSSDPSTRSPSVKPFTVPNAPSDVTGFPGMGSATLSWSAPTFNGGSAITVYKATADPGGATCVSQNGSATGCTIFGLTNGVTYTFKVTATNLAGTSDDSGPSSPLVLTVPPSPPSQIIATPGNTEVSVAWTAPSDNGGAAVDAYTVTAFGDGGVAAGSCTTPDGLTTSCLVTGLVNGTTYTFSVIATNVAGSSLASAPSDPSIPFTSPGAPTGLTVTPSNQSVTVAWTAPLSSGGFPITGYTVTASPSGKTCDADGATTTCTVLGLSNGQAYTFVVTSTTGHGTPASSPSSPSTTPYTVPGTPTAVVAQPADRELVVSWTAPSDDGGNAVSSYTATAWTSLNASAGTCTTSDGSTTGCTISGLTNGVGYTVTVVATNLAGTSAASSASTSAIPFTTPGAPTSVVVTPGNTTITVSWVAPVATGGLPLLGYTVLASPGEASCAPQDASSTTCTIEGLTNGEH